MNIYQLKNNSEISRAIWDIIQDSCDRSETILNEGVEEENTADHGSGIHKIISCIPTWAKKVNIAISGGSLAKILSSDPEIIDSVIKANYINRLHWYWADERCVPLNHTDSNYNSCVEMFKKLGVPGSNIHTINPALIHDPKAAASDYAQTIKNFVKDEQFDLVLLGMGPDGHTASLFPNHSLLDVKDTSVAAIYDSPKQPDCRISLTLSCLNKAKCVAFAATGASKAEVLHKMVDENISYPASMVDPRPNGGRLYWLLDEDAAKDLQTTLKQNFSL